MLLISIRCPHGPKCPCHENCASLAFQVSSWFSRPWFRQGSRPSPKLAAQRGTSKLSCRASRDRRRTAAQSRNARGGLRIQAIISGPLSDRNKGWDHIVSRRRQLKVWSREQGQRDEQCFSDAASCQTGCLATPVIPGTRSSVTRASTRSGEAGIVIVPFLRQTAGLQQMRCVIKQRCCLLRSQPAL